MYKIYKSNKKAMVYAYTIGNRMYDKLFGGLPRPEALT